MVSLKNAVTKSQFNKILQNWQSEQNRKTKKNDESRKQYLNRFTKGVDIPSVMKPGHYKGNQFIINNNNRLVLTKRGQKTVNKSQNPPKITNYDILEPNKNNKQIQILSNPSSKKPSPKMFVPPPAINKETSKPILRLGWYSNKKSPRKNKNNKNLTGLKKQSTWFTGKNVDKVLEAKKTQCPELYKHIQKKIKEYNELYEHLQKKIKEYNAQCTINNPENQLSFP